MSKQYSLPPYSISKVGDIETLSESINWAISDLDIPEVWKKTNGENVVIVQIDSGVPDHEDINDNIIFDKCKSFVDGEDLWDNSQGHATSVAGLMSSARNMYGTVGIAHKSKLICLKVIGKSGFCDQSSINRALEYCLEIKPDIINMSVGGPGPMSDVHQTIKKLNSQNIVVVCSAGNNGNKKNKSILYPAVFDEVIAVGSYSPSTITSRSLFSCIGPEIDVSAPGEELLTTAIKNQYCLFTGTSASSPVVSGIFALYISYLKSNNIQYTAQSVKSDIIKACKDVGIDGFDHEFGWGIISPKLLFQTIHHTDVAPQSVNNISWWKKLLNRLGIK
jgi:major intracellular serine protease